MVINLGILDACNHSLLLHKDCSLPKKAVKVCIAFFKSLVKRYTVQLISPVTANLIQTNPESRSAKTILLKIRKIEANPAERTRLIPGWNNLSPCPQENRPKTDDGAEEESPLCGIMHDTPKEMVMYNKQPYGYDALVKWYNLKGTNLVNSGEYIDWNKVTKFEPLKPDQDI